MWSQIRSEFDITRNLWVAYRIVDAFLVYACQPSTIDFKCSSERAQ